MSSRKYKIAGFLLFSYLIVGLFAFEIRSLFNYFSFIPNSWSAKIVELATINLPINTPITPYYRCPDYRSVVRKMSEDFPKYSYGQSDFFGFDPNYSEYQLEPIIDRGVSYYEDGIVKWRENEDEPYTAYEQSGNWTIYYDNQNGQGVGVEEIANNLDHFKNSMIRSGFEYSDSNDIPIFRYPDGLLAKKLALLNKIIFTTSL